MSDEISGEFEFNFLRYKTPIKAKIQSGRDITRVLDQHLLSTCIDWEYDTDTNEGKVFVGMFRKVCTFKRIVTKEAL